MRLTDDEWRVIDAAAFKAGLGIGRFLALAGVATAERGLLVDVVPRVGDPIGRGPVAEVLRVERVGDEFSFVPADRTVAIAGTVFLVHGRHGQWRVFVAVVDRRRWVGPWEMLLTNAKATGIAELRRFS